MKQGVAPTLKVRQFDFPFHAGIPFQCNPHNLHWSNFVNFITLIAPGFERYFIKAIRQVLPDIKNAAVRADAELFCQQEAQHSRQHLAHMQVLAAHYPALDEVRRAVTASYERLFARESMAFHLSYAASVELCFGPLASFLIAQRDALFKGGDNTIASFLLWHLVEEFEHRNAAIDVYNDVVGSHWYRVKSVVGVAKHLAEIAQIVRDGFERCIPAGALTVPAGDVSKMFFGIPRWEQLCLAGNLFCTLLPYHQPNAIAQPDWVTQWFADEAAGVDMTNYYRAQN
ncbi:MAG TPA: metal-dependent hydrolase [Pseudomonadales bacterium]|nr:metal-dependent hydrolase [Pseudomonadales bacterium]